MSLFLIIDKKVFTKSIKYDIIQLMKGAIYMAKKNIEFKIQMLLKKTVENGCTEAEAANAAKLVQNLLAKYKLELNALGNDKNEDVNLYDYSFTRKWTELLIHTVANNMCCKTITDYTKEHKVVSILGYKTDVNAVVAMCDTLIKIIKMNVKEEKKKNTEKYGTTKGIEQAYARGFINAVNNEMKKQARALMLIIDEKVENEFKDRYKKISMNKVKDIKEAYGVKDAYLHGKFDGHEHFQKRKITV